MSEHDVIDAEFVEIREQEEIPESRALVPGTQQRDSAFLEVKDSAYGTHFHERKFILRNASPLPENVTVRRLYRSVEVTSYRPEGFGEVGLSPEQASEFARAVAQMAEEASTAKPQRSMTDSCPWDPFECTCGEPDE